MRVIGGDLRGRRLHAPKGTGTRPILDRQKESLFNVLRDHLHAGSVLDVFAGSGGLGIEALSRGMETGVFVERERAALSALRRNLEECRLLERARVVPRDVLRLRSLPGGPFRLALLDPPFPLVREAPQRIAALIGDLLAPALAPDARLMLRLPTDQPAWPVLAGLQIDDVRRMGESVLLLASPR